MFIEKAYATDKRAIQKNVLCWLCKRRIFRQYTTRQKVANI